MRPWVEVQDVDYVMQFLMDLNESYFPQILLIDPLPKVSKVFALVVQEERQCLIGQNLSPGFSQGSDSNFSGSVSRELSCVSYCTHCGMMGHTIDRCYKLHGFPPGHTQRWKINF